MTTASPEMNGPSRQQAPAQQELALLVSLFNQQRYADAETLAHTLTQHYPSSAPCWKMLGTILLQSGRIAEALPPMQQAAVLLPDDAGTHSNLGYILLELGRASEAEASCRRALQLRPDLAGIHNNLGNILKRLGRLAEAESSYRHALTLDPGYADACGNLGIVLRDQGKLAEALDAFRQKLRLLPGDPETMHHVASLSGDNTERAPAEYVIQVFDGYAGNFDNHLQQTLQYNVPEDLASLLRRHAAALPGKWRVLDLGCGTGLAGAAIAPHAQELVGVDLSPKMLEKARERNLYRRLEQNDLLPMMRAETDAIYDVVIATDVFIYVGRIDDIVREAKRLLKPGGILALSIESHDPAPAGAQEAAPNYRLTSSGRYSHAPAYLRELASANAMEILEMAPTRIRVENGKPVEGFLILVQAGS